MRLPRPLPWIIASLVLALAPCAAPLRAATSGEPVTINAILSLTGALAFVGAEESASLHILERVINARGGINGRPVQFVVADDQSNPGVAVQLMSGFAAKRVPAVIGPGSTGPCNAVLPLVKDHGPVTFCLTGNVVLTPGGFGFAGAIYPVYLMSPILRFFGNQGWHRIALLTSNDASGQDFDRAFDATIGLPKNAGFTIVAREHFAPADLSVAAQTQHLKAAAPDAVIAWTSGTAFGTVLRSFAEAGLDVPTLGSNGNMTSTQLAQYAAFTPKMLLFPGFLGMVRGGVRAGPIDDAQAVFFGAMGKNDRPSDIGYNVPWDPTLLIVDALRHAGPDASAEAVRDYLVALHGWTGIFGVYDFRDGSQRGIGENATLIVRWDGPTQKFVVMSRPAGYPR